MLRFGCLFWCMIVLHTASFGQDDVLAFTPMKVKFLGGDNESLSFSVKYESKSLTSFRLFALNESGEVWFQEVYRNTRDFERKLNIPRLTETEYVVFVLRTANEPEITSKVQVTTKVMDE